MRTEPEDSLVQVIGVRSQGLSSGWERNSASPGLVKEILGATSWMIVTPSVSSTLSKFRLNLHEL